MKNVGLRLEFKSWKAAGYSGQEVLNWEKAPEAFIGLLEGKNLGKVIVRVAD